MRLPLLKSPKREPIAIGLIERSTLSKIDLNTSSPYPIKSGAPESSKTKKVLTAFAEHLPEQMPFSGVCNRVS